MSLHKLHIFAKNRNAVAAQKGYAFQQLKTLETWVENRIAGRDEIIYCDYEDDIFARDLLHGKSVFRQIKLYSTDFSFSTDGLQKAISHFFMLYTKGEYSFDQLEFVFETNASIVERTVRGNDADLLLEWFENQDNLTQELIDRIRGRVKAILDSYVNSRVEDMSEDFDLKSDVQQARAIYDKLSASDVDSFIKCVKWRFANTAQNVAVESTLENIRNSVSKLPAALEVEKKEIYLALLVTEVYQRSIQDNPEDRKLSNDLLDAVLLNAGDRESRWYSETLGQFKGQQIERFFPGEFQSVISATRFCRWNLDDEKHKSVWLSLLSQYINLSDIFLARKRKAIYEYLFLKIATLSFPNSVVTLTVEELQWISFYIDNWRDRDHLRDLENDVAILQLLKAAVNYFELDFALDRLIGWEEEMQTFLDGKLDKEQRADIRCELLELRGHLEAQKEDQKRVESTKGALVFYRQILPLLGETTYYSLERLYSQMGEMVKVLIKHDLNPDLQATIDDFMLEIQTSADKTGLQHKAALEYIERSTLYLKNGTISNSLKALDLLHRAKGLWSGEFVKDKYVLTLIRISQVYSRLGMHYAAKNYALIALWANWNFSDPSLFKLLPHCLALICISAFRSGAWVNALTDFNLYLFIKREFDERGFEIVKDDLYKEAIFKIAAIFHAVPLIYPDLSDYMESLKVSWGFIWKDQIAPGVNVINGKIGDVEKLKDEIKESLDGKPFSDIGLDRIVRFKVLGIEWTIRFANNVVLAAIGEEFLGCLQITLCEIGRYEKTILKREESVSIIIKEGHFDKREAEPGKWDISIPNFDSNVKKEIQLHYVYIDALVRSIISSVSLLSKSDFNRFYIEHLLAKEKLGEKILFGTAYQRAFKSSLDTSGQQLTELDKYPPLDDDAVPVNYRDLLT